jgi:hypothetical protein
MRCMKSSCVCPKCQGQKFYVVEQPRCRVDVRDNPPGTAKLGVAYHRAPTGEDGWLGPKKGLFSAPVEAWVCAGCSYTELYTRHLEVLAHLAKQDDDDVRIVDAEAGSSGVFR